MSGLKLSLLPLIPNSLFQQSYSSPSISNYSGGWVKKKDLKSITAVFRRESKKKYHLQGQANHKMAHGSKHYLFLELIHFTINSIPYYYCNFYVSIFFPSHTDCSASICLNFRQFFMKL